MSKKIRTEAVDYLFDAILSLQDKEECYTFFEDICTINELLSLEDKSEAMKVLENTVEMHSDEEVRDNARSVKALMALS